MDAIKIALAAIGVLGAGGGLLLLVFAPALLTVIVTWVERILAAVLRTRLGCAVVAGLVCWLAADLYRSHEAAAACDARVEQNAVAAEHARLARDAAIGASIELKHAGTISALKKTSGDLQQRATDYERRILALQSAAVAVAPVGGKQVKPAAAPAGGCKLGAEPLQLRKAR